MGKRIISQRRGRGSPTYKAPSHRFRFKSKYTLINPDENQSFVVLDIVRSQAHSAPLMILQNNFDPDHFLSLIAPEGIRVGDEIKTGPEAEIKDGNILALKYIPEGANIFNIEIKPGDGGKLIRSSGTTAKLIVKTDKYAIVQLPSKKKKEFNLNSLATIGVVAGSGRTDKPLLKAGKKYHIMKAKNKLYPHVHGTSMNAVDHPFGGSSSANKGRPTTAPKNAPPGRKVGKIRPRRTGYRK